jgi:hypothetical protein
LEILIITDAHHSSRPSCNLLQRIVRILSYPYKIAKRPNFLEKIPLNGGKDTKIFQSLQARKYTSYSGGLVLDYIFGYLVS